MTQQQFKYLYGPVWSWRLGQSLGVDPISRREKYCTFDCVYCQVGITKIFTTERQLFVPVAEVAGEVRQLEGMHLDYITFSGNGEPTLASNLGEMIEEIKKIRNTPVAVITNSSLMDRADVRSDLAKSDYVLAKLDFCSPELFQQINRPIAPIEYRAVVWGIQEFRNQFPGRLGLQVMFVAANQDHAEELANLVNVIRPDEVHVNTPLRPSGAKPLSEKEIRAIKDVFSRLCDPKISVTQVYDAEKKKITPINEEDTRRRRNQSC